ncbi:MAG: ankyrin repeat domain-containing protein [Gammaproteobacteria bacterium]|nr:ankyrin repeat domain-containing protein [Gammaproteobacteria bacterium]
MKTATLKEVAALSARPPGLQVRDNGWTPLRYAAGVGRVEVVGRPLDLGANPGARTRRSGTALYVAAASGNNS